jgi:hypothetical protein
MDPSPLRNSPTCYTPSSSTPRYTLLRRPPAHCAILPSIRLVILCPRTLAGDNRFEVADTGYDNTKRDRQQAAGSAVIPPTYGNCFRGLSINGIP